MPSAYFARDVGQLAHRFRVTPDAEPRTAVDTNIDGDPPLILTPQDKADLLAYLKLL